MWRRRRGVHRLGGLLAAGVLLAGHEVDALVSAGPDAGSNVPVAETAPCPLGYYRRALLVFARGAQDGEVYFPLSEVSKTAVGIPKGVRNLKLTAQASGPVTLFVDDPSTGETIASSQIGNATAMWRDVTVTYTSVGRTKDAVAFDGTTQDKLQVRLANHQDSQNLATITYSYDDFEDCPAVPVGCEEYNAALIRTWVYNWSAWVSTTYPKASDAWHHLCSDATATQYGNTMRAGPVPFHLWHGVWTRWPAAQQSGLTWQAAFKFIDSLHTEDGLVEVNEFIKAYTLAGVGLSMFTWCVRLHERYGFDSSAAWAAVGGPTGIAGIDYSRWHGRVWPFFMPPDNFNKASSDSSFMYADTNNNGVVSRKEFDAIFGTCHNPAVPTRTITTTQGPPTAMPPTTYAQAVPSNSTSDSEDATLASTGGDSSCCREVTASCLACSAGKSVGAFCSDPAFYSVLGCQGSAEDAVRDPYENTGGCPYSGVAYTPLMSDQDQSSAQSPGSCQARCARTPGCAFFSFHRTPGTCGLHGAFASFSAAEDMVSGPSVCVAEIGIRVSDINFAVLTDTQKRDIMRHFVLDIAKVTALPVSAVRDLVGKEASMTLTAGSLVAGSHLQLPPGWTVENISSHASGLNLVRRIRASVLAVNLAGIALAEHPIHKRHAIDVSVEASTDCFLQGTAYGLPDAPDAVTANVSSRQEAEDETESPSLWLGRRTSASSAGACQGLCAEEPRCDVFTFWRDDAVCFLLGGGGSALPIADALAVGGPRACPTPPKLLEAASFIPHMLLDTDAEGEASEGAQISPWWLFGAVLVCCAGGLSLAAWALLPKRRKKSREAKAAEAKYAPLSRQDDDEEGSQDPEDSLYERGQYSQDEVESSDAAPSTVVRSTTPACAHAFMGPEVLRGRNA